MANGVYLQGKQVAEDSQTAIATLQLENGMTLEIPRSNVRASVAENDALKFYRENASKVADQIEAHQKIRDYLIKAGFKELALAHIQRIVELAPDNRSAWRQLGFSETSAGWVPSELHMKSKGMVRDGSKWRTPQDLAIAKILEERKRTEFDLRRKIDTYYREFNSSGRRGEEAKRFFADLKNPAALPMLVEKISDKETDAASRLFLVDVMLRLDARSLTRAVVRIYVNDESVEVRDRCLDYLIEHPSEEAIFQLAQFLKNDNPDVINRAGDALALIGDKRIIPELIEALVTSHTREVGPDTKYNLGFQGNGNVNMQQGGKRKVELESRNNGVLNALNSLTGADLSYSKEAWREWYARDSATTNLELRRDP